jgi:ACS family glucarate transporter-like MFS transporter
MIDLMPDRNVSTQRLVVAGVFVLAFLTIVDRVCISSAQSSIAAELRITDLQFGWVFGAFTVGYAAFMIPAGWCADVFGPRRVLTTIVCFWSLFTVLTGSMNTLGRLIAIRLMFGLAEAGAYPGAGRALYSWVPASGRGTALGLLNTGSRLGAAIGLPMLSYAILWFGWRPCFRVLGSVGVIWALWWYWWYRNPLTEPADAKQDRWRQRVARRRQGEEDNTTSPVANPGWISILFSRSGSLLLFQYFANNFSYFLVYSWMLPYLERRFDLRPSLAGLYSGMPMFGGIIATWLGGVIVDCLFRRGHRAWSRAFPAAIGFGIASLGILLAGAAREPFWSLLGFGAVVFGLDMTVSSSWTLSIELGREHAGAVSGAMNMAGAIGSFACALAFPYILQQTGRETGFFMLAAILNVGGAMTWYCLSKQVPVLSTK